MLNGRVILGTKIFWKNFCGYLIPLKKGRAAVGIKAYCANLKFFRSRLVTKSSKLKLHRTVIRPIVT